MSIGFMMQTVLEIIVALFVIWCFINEQKLVRIEDRIRARIVRKIRRRRLQKLRAERERVHARCAYRPELPGDMPRHVA